MDSYCFPSTQLPGASKLYSAYLSDFERLRAFYFHPPQLRVAARESKKRAPGTEALSAVVEILRGQNAQVGHDASVTANLDRLQKGAVAVVTGQQAGLLTGPAYTIHKAATAIGVARALTQQGVQAVPVFWMATEDHDVEEVNQSVLLHRGELVTLQVRPEAGDQGRSVGSIALGSEASAVARRAIEVLGGPDTEAVTAIIESAVRPEETFGSSFAKLLSQIFAGRGLILLDPCGPGMHRLAIPVLRQAIEGGREWTERLLARNQALERAGFHAQVKVTESSTPLFLKVEGKRTAIRYRGEKFLAGAASFTKQELRQKLEERPEDFSANALLRPVVQDSLLPTAVFIAGPAEIAYLAQSEVLYREALGRMPVVLARAGFTLVEPHVARLLKKYDLRVEDAFAGAGAIRRRLEQKSLPGRLTGQLEKGEVEMRAMLRKLSCALRKLDPTLEGAVNTTERKMLYQLGKLRDKTARAQAFRSGVVAQHEQALVNSLFPHKGPQERTLCMLPFLARHGRHILDHWETRATETGMHHVFFL